MVEWINLAASGVLVALALSDLRARRLPNGMVAGLVVLYAVHALVAGSADAPAPGAHAIAAAIASAVAALLYRLGWIAGGDVKLAAAVFLWAGPGHALPVFFIVSVCGLVIGLGMLGASAAMRLDARAARWIAWLAPARGVPYGVALAAGGAAAVWWPSMRAPSASAFIGRLFVPDGVGLFAAFASVVERGTARHATVSLVRHLGFA